MRVHWFQHVPFEGLGSIEPWLLERGHQLSVTRFQHWGEAGAAALPDLDAVDLLIAMGGPMSVNDEAIHPWLEGERRCIAEAIGRGIPVLGICLGAQLIASALGARVLRNPQPEIGWFPVQAIPVSSSAPARAAGPVDFVFPQSLPVFHWHGETFELPAGAVPLARSAGCANQAFQLGTHVFALQFHLETTPEAARALVEHCGDELVAAPFVQSAEEILAAPPARYAAAQAVLHQLLTALCDRSG
ncbi:MAG: gamma-glutamyl-gamma-aminobutyrate hydrolase family protein [Cyanobium sp. Prado107]|jgi:GMP synthase-like glutamine amidotransferase|nr:gamma-glutamyl-gamma-aminobutyrate hydrolase family protein [Cyanobium sp. Prado107]